MAGWIQSRRNVEGLSWSRLHIGGTKWKPFTGAILLGLLPIVGLLALWHVGAVYSSIPDYVLPAPLDVLQAFQSEVSSGRAGGYLMQSLSHYTLGLSIGIALGVSLGLLVGSVAAMRQLLLPLIALLRPIPPLAWIPFAILAIGINTQAAAFIIGLGAFYINFYNTFAGVRGVDRKLVEAARTLGDGGIGLVLRVTVPAALPSILTGIRISLGQGWMTVIAAEMFGIPGLGQRLIEASGLLAMEIVITYMIIIGLMYLLMDFGFRVLEQFLLRWR